MAIIEPDPMLVEEVSDCCSRHLYWKKKVMSRHTDTFKASMWRHRHVRGDILRASNINKNCDI